MKHAVNLTRFDRPKIFATLKLCLLVQNYVTIAHGGEKKDAELHKSSKNKISLI